MKELTIEEKAKAYDEALDRAKKMQKNSNGMILKKWLWNIFPELKESEDEKIRKALIRFHKSTIDVDGIKGEDIITWLEKQKESELSENLNDYIVKLSKQFPEVSFAKLSRITVRVKNWLEKQGESYTKRDVDDAYLKGICDAKNELEKQSEQKPFDYENANIQQKDFAPKIEPKFKVGDWITNSIETVQITGYDIDYGYQVDYKGNLQHRDTDIIEKEYHLWTINDAKDGDILITKGKPQPFIFKKYDEDTDYVYAYCGICDLVKDDSFYANGSDEDDQLWTCYSVNGDIYPATEEQREQLEKAMADAGYEWDDENKELKNIKS